jgi:hypothetical protein
MTKDLGELRTGVAQARDASMQAQNRMADAIAHLAKVRGSGLGDLAAAQAKFDSAKAAVAAAQTAADVASKALRDGVVAAVGGLSVASVAPANVPVALLPVGIETRFSGDTLLVRVIPDQIHVEEHEPELNDAEVDAGRAFWRSVWRGGMAEPAATEAERQAWIGLASAIGNSRRASWIADQTAPTGGNRPATPVANDQPLPEPVFPDPPRRSGVWSQPATTRTLPDRFVAIAYRRNGSGGTASWTEIARAQGGLVDDSVQLGFDPGAAPPAVNDNGPSLPDGMQWLIDADAADRAGLLVRLKLPAGTNSIDRLLVLGVLTTLDPVASAARLAELLVGHHHSTGLEVLRIGTPTNNTAADTSGFARRDDPSVTFGIERRTPAPPDGTDGRVLARALGIPADTLRGVANSNETEQAAAGQVNALVWPSAMGYWFDSLVQPGLTDSVISDIRRHAVQMVRGRGPLPPLRIGRQPYGILPVTSLSGWMPLNDPPGVVQMVRILRLAYPWWLDGITRAPIVRAGADPDHGVLDALGQAPVSGTVGVRSMIGANVCCIPSALASNVSAGNATAEEANRQRWLALVGFRALGIDGFPFLGQLVAQHDPIPNLNLPYTVDTRLPGDQQTAAWQAIVTYLNHLRGRRTTDFKAEDPRGLTSVLTLLARRSVMLERLRAGIRDVHGVTAGILVEPHLSIDSAPAVSASLISTTATLRIGQTMSVASGLLAGSVRQPNGSVRQMADYLDQQLVISGIIDAIRYRDYDDTLNAAEEVAKLAPDRAALLLGEAVDVASYRFDAWITSLATRRLSDLRATTPAGITLGAYSAVEDLVRRPARVAVTAPPPGAPTPLVTDPISAGYIHAPSLAQAATAAVLRAGHLSHSERDPNSAALAIDLSSARVRIALGLLDGVRQGQSLGALLGYRAERQLHDLGAHTAVEVVRRLAPPPTVTAAGTPEGLPPRAVCDGLNLSRLDRATILAAARAAGADSDAVGTVVNSLTDAVDAVADLLLAESVHQIVKGNPDRAAAALDALNHGEGGLIEPDVVNTPRTGTALTNRVMIAIGRDAPAADNWPADGIRATAEPRVAAWAGHMLGDPSGIEIKVTRGTTAPIILKLTGLRLGALDVIYEDLRSRVLRHARGLGATEVAAVDLTAPPLAAFLAMATLLRDVLTHMRAGSGLDLARPQDRGGVITGPPPPGNAVPTGTFTTVLADVDHGARRSRLNAASQHLKSLCDALPALKPKDPAPAEAAIRATLDALAGFGLAPGGDPARAPDTATLIALRSDALARFAKATASPDDAAALFGDGFPVLALAAAPFPPVVNASLALDPIAVAPPALLAPLGGAGAALNSWIETTGRVRPAVGRLADLLLAARLRGTATVARLRAMQIPAEPFPTADPARRSQWVGLTFPAALGPDPVTSFVLHTLGTFDAAAGVALLVVDEYTETVPGAATTTAVSFNFDAPGARPPQTVLLAVPPVAGTPWSIDMLASVVGETLDLAKVRMVDLSAVAWAGRFVPTLYLTDGDVGNGVDLPMREIIARANAQFLAIQP